MPLMQWVSTVKKINKFMEATKYFSCALEEIQIYNQS